VQTYSAPETISKIMFLNQDRGLFHINEEYFIEFIHTNLTACWISKFMFLNQDRGLFRIKEEYFIENIHTNLTACWKFFACMFNTAIWNKSETKFRKELEDHMLN